MRTPHALYVESICSMQRQSAYRKLNDLFVLYCSRCEPGQLPQRSQFPVEDLVPWLGNLSIIDVQTNPVQFSMRLHGSLVAAFDGRDWTGRSIEELAPPGLQPVLLSAYQECLAQRQPIRDTVASSGGDFWVERLVLPFINNDGLVDQLLSCVMTNFAPNVDRSKTVFDSLAPAPKRFRHVPGAAAIPHDLGDS